MSLTEKKQVREEEAQLLVRESEVLDASDRKRHSLRVTDVTTPVPFVTGGGNHADSDTGSTGSAPIPVSHAQSVGSPPAASPTPLNFGSIGSDGSGRYVAAHPNGSGRYSYSSAYQDEEEQDETLYFDPQSQGSNDPVEEPRTWVGFITNPLAAVFPPS